MFFRLSPVALAACASLSPIARAQAQDSNATQQVLVTGTASPRLDARPASTSRLGLSVRETPATVTVIDRAQIDALQAGDTQSLLQAIPGVSWSSQPGAPGSLFYRGFGASSLAQLYNGISVQYDAIAARPIDSWLVERVEAIGGPSSFLHGSGAVGGSINLISKVADTQGDLSQARLTLGDVRALGLSLQRSLGGTADAQVLRLDAHASRGATWTQGDDRSAWQAALSWRAPIAAGLVHTLAAERQHERVTQPYWGTPLLKNADGAVLGAIALDPATLGRNYNVVDGLYQQEVTWLRSVLQWDLAPATRLTHTAYHYDALRDYENVETYAFVDANRLVERSAALLQRHDQRVWGSRGEFSHRARLAGRRSDFAAGWDWSYNRQTRFPLSVAGPFDRTDPAAPADRWFLQTPGISRTYTPGATNLLHTLALFAENRTALGGGFALTSGLRLDRIDLEVRNHRTVTATNPALYQRRFTPATGRLGLVKDLSPAWQVYAQLSTAADPPAGVLATAGFSALRDFELTRGRQVELGSKASFDQGRGDASVAVYEIVRRNLAMADPADRTQVIPVGRQSSRGIEASAQWRASPAWQLAGQLSYTDARYEELVEVVGASTVSRAGNAPANTPDWVAGASASWQALPTLQLRADWRHVGRRFGNTANTVWERGYSLIGLGASWQPDPRLTLRARIDNAGVRVYAATLASSQAYLGAPRTVRLSAEARW